MGVATNKTARCWAPNEEASKSASTAHARRTVAAQARAAGPAEARVMEGIHIASQLELGQPNGGIQQVLAVHCAAQQQAGSARVLPVSQRCKGQGPGAGLSGGQAQTSRGPVFEGAPGWPGVPREPPYRAAQAAQSAQGHKNDCWRLSTTADVFPSGRGLCAGWPHPPHCNTSPTPPSTVR